MKRQEKTSVLRRMLDAMQRRFRAARPGSVLIMVITLLVLLALIGTAAISTARIDRTSSRQHVANVQIDMLVEGVRNMLIAEIVNAGNYTTNLDRYDSPAVDPEAGNTTPREPWLMSRLPERLMLSQAEALNGGSGPIAWRFPGAPAVKSGRPYRIDPPNTDSVSNPNNWAYDASKKWAIVPGTLRVNNVLMPALQFFDVTTQKYIGGLFLAGDADGDGIADSLPWRLPMSPINGVTYFGFSRVIDNNSALNVNTAWTPNYDYNLAGLPSSFSMAGVFPGSIDLVNQVIDNTVALDSQRAIGDWRGTAGYSLVPLRTDFSNAGFKFATATDALWMQLGRRLDYPGANMNGMRYGNGVRPFSIADGIALAYRFTIASATSNDSTIELSLPKSCRPAPYGNVRSTPYYPGDIALWFNNNFNYPTNGGRSGLPAKAMLVSHNPIRNQITRTWGVWEELNGITQDDVFNKWAGRANLNTAQFKELWQSWFDVMAEGPLNTPFDDDAGWLESDIYKGQKFAPAAPFTPIAEDHPDRMFRSTIRGADATIKMHPYQVMVLRAAIAAANTRALREGPNAETFVEQVNIPALNLSQRNPPAANAPAFTARVFGLKRQPFLTEIYFNTDPNEVPPTQPPDPNNPPKPKWNPNGLVIVEIHNPYDVPLPLANHGLYTIDRASFPTLNPTQLDDAAFAGATVPAKGFLIITNYKPDAADTDADSARVLPPYVGNIDLGKAIYVRNLHEAIGKELLIARTVQGFRMPIDSFDATGLRKLTRAKPEDEKKGPCEVWYYNRANSEAAGRAWNFVYPGRYQVTANTVGGRHQGTHRASWDPTQDEKAVDPWIAAAPRTFKFGQADDTNSRDVDINARISNFPIQIFNTGSPGPFGPGTAGGGQYFPFGGFARVGDAMQVPFIGSYIIEYQGGQACEYNAVTMDSVFAEDTDTLDDLDPAAPTAANMPLEDVGRFSAWDAGMRKATGVVDPADRFTGTSLQIGARTEPNGTWATYDLVVINGHGGAAWTRQTRRVTNSQSNGGITIESAFNPSDIQPGDTYRLERVRYSWASDLFDYFTTIASPADDYLPQADGAMFGGGREKIRNQSDPSRPINRDGIPNENDIAAEGLININSANWRVLAALPLVVNNDGSVNRQLSERLARRIVYFRDIDDGMGTISGQSHPHGPFRNVMELNMVPKFQTAEDTLVWDMDPKNDASLAQGDWTPISDSSSGRDFVRCDFEEKFLTLNRISNLVTTRADCFTVYILIQGWRDAGTANARLVAQRRAAFIIDRSAIYPAPTPVNSASVIIGNPKVYNIPVE